MPDRIEVFLERCIQGMQVTWPSFRGEAEACLNEYRSQRRLLEAASVPEPKPKKKGKKDEARSENRRPSRSGYVEKPEKPAPGMSEKA